MLPCLLLSLRFGKNIFIQQIVSKIDQIPYVFIFELPPYNECILCIMT